MNNSSYTYVVCMGIAVMVGMVTCQVPLPETMPAFKMDYQTFKVTQEISPYQTLISIIFDEINFEVDTQFFIQSGFIDPESILDKNQYDNKFSSACITYPTTLTTTFMDHYQFEPTQKLLKYTSSQKSAYTSVFILFSNNKIAHIAVKPNSLQKMDEYTFNDEVAPLIEGNLDSNVEMLEVNGYLYVFSANNAHRVELGSDRKQFIKLSKYSVQGHSTVTGCGIYKWNSHEFWVSTQKQIFVFVANSDNSLKEVKKIDDFTEQTISAIEYDLKQSKFFITTLDTLHIIQSESGTHLKYQLHGICQQITKVESTLYLGCEYDRINYVAQLRISDEQVNVNRYYDDAILEGIRKVEPLGYDKVAFLGDDEVMVAGEGVHRDILLQMQKQNRQQNRRFLYSYGIIDFINLRLQSTQTQSKILAISSSKVSLYKVDQIPPEIQCIFRPKQFPEAATILIAFNTSHCPYKTSKQESLTGTQVICESLFPFQIIFNVHQYEQKTAKFIFFIMIATFFLCALACAGWGIQIRAKATQAIQKLKEKIQKAQQERASKAEKI